MTERSLIPDAAQRLSDLRIALCARPSSREAWGGWHSKDDGWGTLGQNSVSRTNTAVVQFSYTHAGGPATPPEHTGSGFGFAAPE